MDKYLTTHLPPEQIDALRFQAFRTNKKSDIDAYYKAASLYFQERLEREMNRADRIEELSNCVAVLEAKLATCEKYKAAYAECDRIGTQAVRDLEAKLTKAAKALERIASGEFSGRMLTSMPPQDAAAYFARTTLAELKGETDARPD